MRSALDVQRSLWSGWMKRQTIEEYVTEMSHRRREMTNWETHREDFERMGLNPDYKAKIAKRVGIKKDGALMLCGPGTCFDCIFFAARGDCEQLTDKWLDEEAEPKKKPHNPQTDKKAKKEKIKVGDTVKVKAKKKPRIVVYQDGNEVIAKNLENGKIGKTTCCKEDIFDFNKGAFIAISRLLGYDEIFESQKKKIQDILLSSSKVLKSISEIQGIDVKQVVIHPDQM